MLSKFFGYSLFILIFTLAGNVEIFPQKRQSKLSLRDKREIIRLILQNKDFRRDFSRLSEKSLLLSTKNIPPQLQRNFPRVKGLSLKLVSPKEARNSSVHLSFENFDIRKYAVKVHFSGYYPHCFRDMLYTFRKRNGRWRFKANYNHRSCY